MLTDKDAGDFEQKIHSKLSQAKEALLTGSARGRYDPNNDIPPIDLSDLKHFISDTIHNEMEKEINVLQSNSHVAGQEAALNEIAPFDNDPLGFNSRPAPVFEMEQPQPPSFDDAPTFVMVPEAPLNDAVGAESAVDTFQPAAPVASFEAPASSFGAPVASFDAPSSVNAPASFDAQPVDVQASSFNAQPSSFDAPPSSFDAPPSSFDAPQPAYDALPPSLDAQPSSFDAPSSFNAPASSFDAPAPSSFDAQAPSSFDASQSFDQPAALPDVFNSNPAPNPFGGSFNEAHAVPKPEVNPFASAFSAPEAAPSNELPIPETCNPNDASPVSPGQAVSYKHPYTGQCGKPMSVSDQSAAFLNSYLSAPALPSSSIISSRPTLITAASGPYFQQSLSNIFVTSTKYQDHKIIYWDLGLDETQVALLRAMDQSKLEYRKFNWEEISPELRNPKQMAWKITVVMKGLAEFGSILWFDAAVALKGDYRPMITEVAGVQNSCFVFTNGPAQIDAATIVSSPVLPFWALPDKNSLVGVYGGQSHSFLAFNTEECQREIWKPLGLCSGHLTCMDPSKKGSRICGANIHECRHIFDTSALTAVLNNFYQNNAEKYRLRSTLRTMTEPKTPKLEMGIVAFMDKLKWHNLSTKEAGFFLEHMGITDQAMQAHYVNVLCGGERGDL